MDYALVSALAMVLSFLVGDTFLIFSGFLVVLLSTALAVREYKKNTLKLEHLWSSSFSILSTLFCLFGQKDVGSYFFKVIFLGLAVLHVCILFEKET
jgi:steroid 5-alpha reductase family enzyme